MKFCDGAGDDVDVTFFCEGDIRGKVSGVVCAALSDVAVVSWVEVCEVEFGEHG